MPVTICQDQSRWSPLLESICSAQTYTLCFQIQIFNLYVSLGLEKGAYRHQTPGSRVETHKINSKAWSGWFENQITVLKEGSHTLKSTTLFCALNSVNAAYRKNKICPGWLHFSNITGTAFVCINFAIISNCPPSFKRFFDDLIIQIPSDNSKFKFQIHVFDNSCSIW